MCVCVFVCPIEILRMAALSIELSHVLCIKSNYLQNECVVCLKTLSFLRYSQSCSYECFRLHGHAYFNWGEPERAPHLRYCSVANLENEKRWFQFIVALARRKIFVGHAHFRSREDTYLSHDITIKLPLTLSARDAYMHKSPLPFPAGCIYIYAHLTYFTFACLPTYFAYCRGFCCSHQLLRASHFTHYSIKYNGRG